MTCYRISHGDESIAIVNSLGMAQAITGCQPPGYYRVDEIQVDSPEWNANHHVGGRGSAIPGAAAAASLRKIGSEDFAPPSGCPTTSCEIASEQPAASRERSRGFFTPDLSPRVRPMPIRGFSSETLIEDGSRGLEVSTGFQTVCCPKSSRHGADSGTRLPARNSVRLDKVPRST